MPRGVARHTYEPGELVCVTERQAPRRECGQNQVHTAVEERANVVVVGNGGELCCDVVAESVFLSAQLFSNQEAVMPRRQKGRRQEERNQQGPSNQVCAAERKR